MNSVYSGKGRRRGKTCAGVGGNCVELRKVKRRNKREISEVDTTGTTTEKEKILSFKWNVKLTHTSFVPTLTRPRAFGLLPFIWEAKSKMDRAITIWSHNPRRCVTCRRINCQRLNATCLTLAYQTLGFRRTCLFAFSCRCDNQIIQQQCLRADGSQCGFSGWVQ